MSKETLEERVEAIEKWQHKIDGYGKIAMGAFGAVSVMAAFFSWLVDKVAKFQ